MSQDETEPPIPEPWEHPPPFLAPLSAKGLKAALLLFRKAWDEELFDEVLIAAGCLPAPESLAALSSEERSSQERTGRTNWYRQLANNESLAAKLGEFADARAALAGYKPLLMLVKEGRESVYSILLETIHACGVMSSMRRRGTLQVHPLVIVAALYAELTGAHCWTLYDWSQKERRPRLVEHQGLWYPEAVVGSSVLARNLQRLLLAEDVGDGVQMSEPTSATTLGFAGREGIEACWAVPVRWSTGRAVLFLNWRATGEEAGGMPVQFMEAKNIPELSWRDNGHPVKEPADVDTIRPRVTEADDLLLAMRYLCGWLTSTAVPAVPEQVLRTPVSAMSVQRSITALFDQWLNAPGEPIRGRPTLSKLTGVKPLLLDILRDVPDAKLEVFPCAPDGESLQIATPNLCDWRGSVTPTGELRIAAGKRGLVKEGAGLVVQSLAWAASIQMNNLPADLTEAAAAVAADPLEEHSLLRRRLWTIGAGARAELVVPMFSGRKAMGGISVEAKTSASLSPAHLHWLEAISLSIGSLHRLCSESGSELERGYVFQRFMQGTNAPNDYESLWSVLSSWALEHGKADIAHVTMPGHGLDTRYCGSVSVSRNLCTALAELGTSESRWIPSNLRKVLRSSNVERVAEAIRPLLGEPDAGHSRRLLAGGEKRWEWSASAERAVQPLADRLFARATAFALGPHEDAAPSAVLWLAYLKPSSRQTLAPPLMSREVEHRLRRLGEFVASLDLVYRVSDPS